MFCRGLLVFGHRVRYSSTKAAVDPLMRSPAFSASQRTTQVTVQWNSSSRFQFIGADDASHGHSKVTMSLDSSEPGVSPSHLLLIALGGCASVNIKSILAKKKILVNDISVSVTGQKHVGSNEAIEGWATIHAEFVITGPHDKSEHDEEIRRVIDSSVNKYCGVHKTLAHGVPNLTWTYKTLS